jgi:hypothetical protein
MYDKSITDRFWSKVKFPDLVGTKECWIWDGAKGNSGYGNFWIDKQTKKAHRVAYMFCIGDILEGMDVLHNCPNGDNPSCVNPAHLWLGTAKDNVQDMLSKGRQVVNKGENHWTHIHPELCSCGENNGKSKVTGLKVKQMRTLYAEGNISLRKLAEEFDLSLSATFSIITYQTWKHI